jgi:hypothetical protein
MITQVSLLIAGFVSVATIEGLFGSTAFYILAFTCEVLFFYLSLGERMRIYTTFFIGFVLGLEEFSTAHAGLGLLFGGISLLLAYFLPRFLRFTTPVMQSIVGLLMVLALYTLLLFGFAHFFHRFLLLLPIFFIAAAFAASMHSGRIDASYETI